jgi:hypothetical protein
MILAIDPGPKQSAWVRISDTGFPVEHGKEVNEALRDRLAGLVVGCPLALEMIASYGMPVGAEVFETCVWIGRFAEAYPWRREEVNFILRRDVKLAICKSPKANDASIRCALIDRFGPGRDLAIGKKNSPGPLYGFKADAWAALAVACTLHDFRNRKYNKEEK